MKKIEQEKNRPASNIPYQGVNKPFRTRFVVPGPGVTIEQDANGVLYISVEGGAGVSDLVAGDNIELTKTDDGKIIISAVDTATDIAAGQNITIDIDPETGTAIINSITGGANNEHYKGVFDTAEDLIAFDSDPEIGDYGMIKQITYSDGGETTWNGQYKYCFYINGQWTVVDQMLTFTDDVGLLQQFYSVGGSSPVIYLHKIAQTGSFRDLRDVPIVATPKLTVDGKTLTATCDTEGAEIWYTTDGTMPHVNGNKYTGPITVNEATTFRFVGIKNGMINSLEATIGVEYQLQPPTIDLDWHDGTITMANPNQSGTIYYTTDGSTPTNASNAYTGPFIIDEATLFKLVVIDGNNQSSVTEQQYLQAHPVTNFARSTNWPFGRATITFSNSEEGEAHYEMNDSIPTYNSPLSQGSITFQYYDQELNPRYYSVRVFKEGKVPSVVATSLQNGKQKPTAPGISFDPETGIVTINRLSETMNVNYRTYLATSGCTIRYTVDGSTPTADSLVYNGPFQISGNATVKAVLIAYGQYYSDVVTESIEVISVPEISLDSDTGFISISGPSGATIYYTIDGSTPTAESTQYIEPFNIVSNVSAESTHTIKAMAIVNNQESAVVEQSYEQLAVPTASGSFNALSGIDRTILTGKSQSAVIRYTDDNSTPGPTSPVVTAPLAYNVFLEPKIKCYQSLDGYVPSTVETIAKGQLAGPDAPRIDYDETTGECELYLVGFSSRIPLQTNNNTPTLGARIYYTLDGSTPSSSNGTLYTGPFALPDGVTTIKAMTECYGEFDSDVTTESVGPAPVSNDYLYFEAAEANSTVSLLSSLPTAPDLEYSTDGETWQEWQHTTVDDAHTFDTIMLSAIGDKVYLRGNNPDGLGSADFSFSVFSMSGKIQAGGSVTSLIDGDGVSLTSLPDGALLGLFARAMFIGGYNDALLSAPSLGNVSQIGTMGCLYMFAGCINMQNPSDMHGVTQIGDSGCSGMYMLCFSMQYASSMPSLSSVGSMGCQQMYQCCTFSMSNDGSSLNFGFLAAPFTTSGDDPETLATPEDIAMWMQNPVGFGYSVTLLGCDPGPGEEITIGGEEGEVVTVALPMDTVDHAFRVFYHQYVGSETVPMESVSPPESKTFERWDRWTGSAWESIGNDNPVSITLTTDTVYYYRIIYQ